MVVAHQVRVRLDAPADVSFKARSIAKLGSTIAIVINAKFAGWGRIVSIPQYPGATKHQSISRRMYTSGRLDRYAWVFFATVSR